MTDPLNLPKTIPPGIRLFLSVLTAGVTWCLLAEIISLILHLGYPYNWPLLFPDVSFWDFKWYFEHFHTFHTAAFFQGPDVLMYPAPVVLCYAFFYKFQPFATPVFLSFILVSTLLAALLAVRALVRQQLPQRAAWLVVGATYLLSYPLWFEVKQANMEIVVWALVTLGLYAFWTDRLLPAALLFGIAGAAKFYPIIYLGLLLSRRRYRECLVGCLVAGATILASLYLVGPTIPVAWHGMQLGLSTFRREYMLPMRPNEIGFDHSLFAVLKMALAFCRKAGLVPLLSTNQQSHLLTAYLLTVATAGSVLYFLRIRHLPIVNQVFALVLASILLPPVSFDYTAIHLYAPWLLLCFVALQSQQQGKVVPGMNAAFLCLGLAASPLSEFIVHHERFGGELRSLVLLATFGIALRYPFTLPFETAHARSPGEPQIPMRAQTAS